MTKPRLSPSQIATYRDCPRKWAFSRILPGRSNKFAELGTRVHTALENWLIGGTLLDTRTEEGLIASSGIEHLPKPGVCSVESDFAFETAAARYTGRRDMRWSEILRAPHGAAYVHVIGDHKTTTNLAWAKTPQDLATDAQGVLYAASVYREPDVDQDDDVELRWVYYTTRRPYKSKRVSLIVTYEETQERMIAIDNTAIEIGSWGEKPDPHTLPVQVAACDKYGGCPYQTECKVTKNERFKAAMTQSLIQQKLRDQLAKKNGAAPAAETIAEAVTTAAEAAPADGPLARLRKLASPSAPTEIRAALSQDPATVAAEREAFLDKEASERAQIAAKPQEPIDELRKTLPAVSAPARTQGLADLRDNLAMSALNGLIARGVHDTEDGLAEKAYAFADAMLRARG